MPKFFMVFIMLLIGACQTIPKTTDFSEAQENALLADGFESVDGNFELGLGGKVLFESSDSDLHPDVHNRVRELAKRLVEIGINGATIEGHTDSSGDIEYNIKLSEKRANTVKHLFASEGMLLSKLRVVAKGESEPISDNDTLDGRRENRRVVVVISSQDII